MLRGARGSTLLPYTTLFRSLDVMIHEGMQSPRFASGSASVLLPAESLLAVVEVKSTLTKAEWKNCLANARSEEHTSELQSRLHLVCRLLLEKKKDRRADARK